MRMRPRWVRFSVAIVLTMLIASQFAQTATMAFAQSCYCGSLSEVGRSSHGARDRNTFLTVMGIVFVAGAAFSGGFHTHGSSLNALDLGVNGVARN